MSQAAAAPDPATTYGAHANPDLLSRIPLDARAVLDVGCGAGALGGAFRRRNPAARLIGIEPDPALAAHARGHYAEVHGTDIETVPPPVAEGSLDAIVFGDVLEHLRDPWAVLARDIRLLSDRGVLLVCIPNLEHWSFAHRLLCGDWRYERMGLFDRTHLRWFTRATMHDALRAAGYVPLEVAPRIFGRDKAEAFAKAMAPGFAALGIDMAEWSRRALPLQYVWRAARVRPDPLLLVGRTLPGEAEAARARILDPLAALATRPGIGTVAGPQAAPPAGAGDTPRLVILQRRGLDGAEALSELRALRRSGAVIVQESDIDPARLPPDAFRRVHAVQVATAAQAAAVRALNPEVAVFAYAQLEGPDGPLLADQLGARLAWYRGLWDRRAELDAALLARAPDLA
ncbi:class I SAM-dependent methyltransferase [Falsiroseomonas sp. CW058]|uniref:class I SAM-dependent methyltransferase n=1 Tax=Falsiroseomonas sp. CW058 TaxID=3388664 RepID=UPI003D31C779